MEILLGFDAIALACEVRSASDWVIMSHRTLSPILHIGINCVLDPCNMLYIQMVIIIKIAELAYKQYMSSIGCACGDAISEPPENTGDWFV